MSVYVSNIARKPQHAAWLFFCILFAGLVTIQPVAGDIASAAMSLRPRSVSCRSAWQPAGTMITIREQHTSTLLPDGMVLVVGGTSWTGGIEPLAGAEIYDPTTNQWRTTASLHHPRYYHTATRLPNGNVLIVGGDGGSNYTDPLASAEIYDPTTRQWQDTGSMHTARALHTATLLPDGRVVVAGGDSTSMASAEIYDSATGSWSITSSLLVGRHSHTATLLTDGQVLVAGGFGSSAILADTEIYSPTAGIWMPTDQLMSARYGHTATVLPDGSVLVTGGYEGLFALGSAERYDPATHRWSPAASLSVARAFHTATLLPNGSVLVAGGEDGLFGAYFARSEIYVPATNDWLAGPDMVSTHSLDTATLLRDDTVLVVGGSGRVSAERYWAAETSQCAMYLPLVV